MNNMQDILKAYYASGGKTLFETEILLEYNRATTMNKWGDRIILAAYANGGTADSDGWFSLVRNRFGPWMDVLTKGASSGESTADLKTYPEYPRMRQQFLTDFLSTLEDIDPTQNKQYVMWLVKKYTQSIKADQAHQQRFEREAPQADLAGHWSGWDYDLVDPEELDDLGNYQGNEPEGGWLLNEPRDLNSFKLEDADQIKQILTHYHNLKPQLPVEQRDINRFKTVERLEDFVDNIMAGQPGPETDDATLNRTDVETIYSGPLGTVAIPHSHEASCELGSGTRWCTTGASDEYYRQYAEQGDLIIYNEKPGNQKYQIHVTADGIEARDSRDRRITAQKEQEFVNTHPVLSKLIKQKQAEFK